MLVDHGGEEVSATTSHVFEGLLRRRLVQLILHKVHWWASRTLPVEEVSPDQITETSWTITKTFVYAKIFELFLGRATRVGDRNA